MSNSSDSVSKTLFVALALSVVCSVLVSVAAIQLRPQQEANRARNKKKNILVAAGLFEPGVDINQVFDEKIRAEIVELKTGKVVEKFDPARFDAEQAAKSQELGVRIEPDEDLAGIGRRAKYAPVYLLEENGEVKRIILPVYGKGLWSTLYGFLALESDTRTIRGLEFYEHGETPGLGGEVDNPRWKDLWDGKIAFGENWDPRIEVIRGAVDPDRPESQFLVDGLAGATITSRGVGSLLRYWLGEQGFGPYLENFRSRHGITSASESNPRKEAVHNG